MVFVVAMDAAINVSPPKFNGHKRVRNNLAVPFLLVKLFSVIRIKDKKNSQEIANSNSLQEKSACIIGRWRNLQVWCKTFTTSVIDCFELYSFERMAEVSARLEQYFPINCNDKSMAMRISPNK